MLTCDSLGAVVVTAAVAIVARVVVAVVEGVVAALLATASGHGCTWTKRRSQFCSGSVEMGQTSATMGAARNSR